MVYSFGQAWAGGVPDAVYIGRSLVEYELWIEDYQGEYTKEKPQ